MELKEGFQEIWAMIVYLKLYTSLIIGNQTINIIVELFLVSSKISVHYGITCTCNLEKDSKLTDSLN